MITSWMFDALVLVPGTKGDYLPCKVVDLEHGQMLPSDETASGAPWPIAKDGFPSEATCRVESYPRRLGVFNLLARALHAMGFR